MSSTKKRISVPGIAPAMPLSTKTPMSQRNLLFRRGSRIVRNVAIGTAMTAGRAVRLSETYAARINTGTKSRENNASPLTISPPMNPGTAAAISTPSNPNALRVAVTRVRS